MEQTKALNALEPFLALSKSATSPRAAADLITRATSSPHTFIFAELLQQTQIQALASSQEFSPHLILLQIFSHGTYETYRTTPNLPELNDGQTLKLRQLSLLSLARDRRNLGYDALQEKLRLGSSREVENLVITAVDEGLIHATLDPSRQTVQVSSISPLRDLEPGSIPTLIAALQNWSGKCTTTLADLESQIRAVRAAAAARAGDRTGALRKLEQDKDAFRRWEEETEASSSPLADKSHGMASKSTKSARLSKRTMGEGEDGADEAESMDVDVTAFEKRASRRKK